MAYRRSFKKRGGFRRKRFVSKRRGRGGKRLRGRKSGMMISRGGTRL